MLLEYHNSCWSTCRLCISGFYSILLEEADRRSLKICTFSMALSIASGWKHVQCIPSHVSTWTARTADSPQHGQRVLTEVSRESTKELCEGYSVGLCLERAENCRPAFKRHQVHIILFYHWGCFKYIQYLIWHGNWIAQILRLQSSSSILPTSSRERF